MNYDKFKRRITDEGLYCGAKYNKRFVRTDAVARIIIYYEKLLCTL